MDFFSNLIALDNILQRLEDDTFSSSQKDAFFENLALTYFQNEPFYQTEFSCLWRSKDFSETQSINDSPDINLIASLANAEGKFCAISTKLSPVTLDEIRGFLEKSPNFAQRVLVTPTFLGKNAHDSISNLQPPLTIIDRGALALSVLDFSHYNPKTTNPVLRAKKKLWPHQERAFDKIIQGFAHHDRGILVMACGTGKTLLSLKVAEKIAGQKALVLYLVPSLALLSQVLTTWTQEAQIPMKALAVCSDALVGKRGKLPVDTHTRHLTELSYPATTQAEPLAQALMTNLA
ncbi:MAG: DEAD/DEAH box helicase family protein [Deltaproteobacteria bacterium]|jgi:predicted helicase|nr:DEAD/DEAH box helicase family protein [Deltaproteobacteria bacterium]